MLSELHVAVTARVPDAVPMRSSSSVTPGRFVLGVKPHRIHQRAPALGGRIAVEPRLQCLIAERLGRPSVEPRGACPLLDARRCLAIVIGFNAPTQQRQANKLTNHDEPPGLVPGGRPHPDEVDACF